MLTISVDPTTRWIVWFPGEGGARVEGFGVAGVQGLYGPPMVRITVFRKLTLSSFCFMLSAPLVPKDVEEVVLGKCQCNGSL